MSLFGWIQGKNNQASSSKDPLKSPAVGVAPVAPGDAVTTGTQQASSEWDGADGKRFGMENFGNTCYANSVLQALYFCQPFREALLASTDSSLPIPAPTPAPPPAPSSSIPPASPLIAPNTPKRTQSKPGHKRAPSLNPSSQPAAAAAVTSSAPYDDFSSFGSSGAGSTPSNSSPAQHASNPPSHEPSTSSATPPNGSSLPVPPSPAWTPTINPNPASLYSAIRSLYSHISQHPQGKGTVAPQAFVNKLKKENVLFRSSMHQDAHEFLNYLLNKIVEDLEEETSTRSGAEAMSTSISSITSTTTTASIAPSAASLSATPLPQPLPLVQSLFQGTLTNETRCLTCERVTSRSEPFLDLSLDIAHNNLSLNHCLRGFSKSEMLTARNKFFCDECCSLVEAEKRMKIKTLPPVLLLHLKRFKYQEDLGRYVKLSYRVAFPFELRLWSNTVDPTEDPSTGAKDTGARRRGRSRPTTGMRSTSGMALDLADDEDEAKGAGSGGPGDPEGLYRLFAVVVHIGGGPHHGHYVTLVKSRGDVWLLFDDDSVEVMRESDIPKYFGDSNFTMGGSVNVATPGAGLAASAKILAANPPAASAAAAPTATASTMFGSIAAPPGAAAPAPTVPTVNAANGTSLPSNTGAANTLNSNATPAAGCGTGYVLFYQAANIDLKGLGLVSAAMEARDAVMASHANATLTPSTVPIEVPLAGQTPMTFPVLIEEPTPTETESVVSETSAELRMTPIVIPYHSPSSESAFSLSSTSTAPPVALQDTKDRSLAPPPVISTPNRGMSLEIPPPRPNGLGAPTSAVEDQLSPLALPPPHYANEKNGASGFFKGLRHSVSKPEHGKLGGGSSFGLGLGLTSPTAVPRVSKDSRTSNELDRKDTPPAQAQAGGTKSASFLPLNGHSHANGNGNSYPNGNGNSLGHVDSGGSVERERNRTPSPAFLKVPYEKSKEKEKEKEKEKGGEKEKEKDKDKLNHWFSSARKSVSRKSRYKAGSERSREREKEKEKEVASQSFGTVSGGTAPSDPGSSSPKKTMAPPSKKLSVDSPALLGQPLPTEGGSTGVTNGYGGWVGGGGQLSGGWVGGDGGVNSSGLATGAVPPGTGSRISLAEGERRASEPTMEGSRVSSRSDRNLNGAGVSGFRPLSMVDNAAASKRAETNGTRNKQLPPTPISPTAPLPTKADGDSDSIVFPPTAVDQNGPSSSAAAGAPPTSLRSTSRTNLTNLRIPSSSKLASTAPPSAMSPMTPSRGSGPRRSMTLSDAFSPSTPIPRPPRDNKDKDDNTGTGSLMKRASRKMSLSGGGIRLSGFGFGSHKEKDRA